MKYLKSKIILVYVASLYFCDGKAQDIRRVDSLKSKMETSSLRENIMNLLRLSSEYIDHDNSIALRYVSQANKLANEVGDSSQIVKVSRFKAQLLIRSDHLEEGVIILNEILPMAERNNDPELSRILNSLALAETFRGNFDKALEYNFRSLVLREDEGDKNAISIALANIGLTFFKLENFKEAIKYDQRALDLKLELGDTYDMSRLLINMSLCFNQLNEHEEAFEHIYKAFKICNGNCKPFEVEGFFALGMIFKDTQQTDSAIIYLNKSLVLSRKSNDRRFQLENLKALAKIYIHLNNLRVAKSFLEEGEAIAKTSPYKQILCSFYQAWSDFYIKENDFKKGYLYNKKYSSLNEKLTTDKLAEVIELQSEFNERENKRIIASQKQILILKEEVIVNHRLVIFLTGLIAILFMVITIYLLRRYRQKQRDNRLLDLKVRERTNSLNENLTILTKILDEQNQFFVNTARDLRGQLKTLRGLINVTRIDDGSEETINQGVILILETEEKLSSVIDRMAKELN